jgi:hypothetical protein
LPLSKAIVTYRDNSCIGLIDWDFGRYYYSLIPKYLRPQKQRYQTHITIVRNFENVDLSDKYLDGQEFSFNYSQEIEQDHKYFYLNCWSPIIDQIRKYYNLRRYRIGNSHHITIGNKK